MSMIRPVNNRDYRIAIPSYKRSDTIISKTLAYLKQTDIDMKRVDVFVSDASEYSFYKKTVGSGINLVKGKVGMGANRNFITDYYPEGQRVLCMDDDIVKVHLKVDNKTLEPLHELHNFICDCFKKIQEKSLSLWGVYPVNNPFFMKDNVTYDLKYIVGCFYGFINRKMDVAYVTFEDKEDFERTIKYYLNDGGVARFNYVSCKTNYYGEKGGMQETRTSERVKESAFALAKKYPYLCKVFISKGRKQYELRLRDKRLQKVGNHNRLCTCLRCQSHKKIV